MELKVIAAGLSVIIITASGTALAQDSLTASERFLACQSIEDSAEKLACFEEAAAAMSAEMATPAAPEPESTIAEAPAVEAVKPVASAAPTQAPEPAKVPVATEPEAPTEPKERRLLPSWIPSVTLRGEKSKSEPDEITISITRIQRNNVGRHFFTTSDGIVWEQIQVEAIKAPKALPANATLKRMLSGSLRLGFLGTSRTYAVRRIV